MLKRIPVADVCIGMFIHELGGSWLDHPFWKTRFLLKSERNLQRLHASAVREVWIDTGKGLDVEGGEPLDDVSAVSQSSRLDAEQPPAVKLKPGLDEEVTRGLKLCSRAKERLTEQFAAARNGDTLDMEELEDQVDEIGDSLLRHPHALLSLTRLRAASDYAYLHAMTVSGLMIGLARQLQWSEAQVREAGLAGLLHDVGESLMPSELLNAPGKLSKIDSLMLRDHPKVGADMLRAQGLSAAVIDVCLHHHEKPDGSGYPGKVQGEAFSQLARMCAICDVFDALTSDRPYQKGWDPAEAIRKMAEWKGQFDEALFQAFIKSMGIYPVGSLVRLESGRLAVVMEQSESSLLTPKVKVFFSSRSKTPIPQEELDLAKLVGREKIVGRESAEDWGFRNLEELWSGERKGRGSLFEVSAH